MSPNGMFGNSDILKQYQLQLSNSLFMPDNRESAFINASPYLNRPVVPKNFNVNQITIHNNFNKSPEPEEKHEEKPKND